MNTEHLNVDGPCDLLRFAETLKIPSEYLPKEVSAIFRNADEAAMWRHLICKILPEHKIKEIRLNILRSKINSYRNGADLPEELRVWQIKNTTLTKLNQAQHKLSRLQDDLKIILAKSKKQELECNYLRKSIKHNSLKTTVYKKACDQFSHQILKTKECINSLQTVLTTNTYDADDIKTKMLDVFMKAKYLISKQAGKTEVLDNELKDIACKVQKNKIWDWFMSNEKQSLSKIINLAENVDIINDNNLISNGCNNMQACITDLSAEHLKICVKVVNYALSTKKYQNKYLSCIKNLEDQEAFMERNYLESVSKYLFLTKKIQIMVQLINNINKQCDDLSDYEKKNTEVLKKIDHIDTDMKKIIANIENLDSALFNTPKKVYNVHNKNYENINHFRQYIINDPELTSCSQYIVEIELLKEIDISQIPVLIQSRTKKTNWFIDSSFNHDFIHNPEIGYIPLKICTWESSVQVIIKLLQQIKVYEFYKGKNNAIRNQYVPNLQKYDKELYDFNDKINSMEKLYKEIIGKTKEVHCLIEFWVKNPLKKYISVNRLFNGKSYKYYEDVLNEFTSLL